MQKAQVRRRMGQTAPRSLCRWQTMPACVVIVQTVILVHLYVYTQRNQRQVPSISNVNDEPQLPHIVFGILSAEHQTERRNAQRNTWIATAMRSDIPFKFTYQFVLDVATPKTIEENKLHNDLIYLNVTTHGYALKYGEKIYLWMKYILDKYPDVLMGVKLDDDVFLCAPKVFEILHLIKSSKLYYGWGHEEDEQGEKITRMRRIDDMFVVVGKELMERISKREYCQNMTVCDEKRQLVDYDVGDQSISTWLSIYDDVDFITDNPQIIHFGAWAVQENAHFIKPSFCIDYFLYHKSPPDVMRQLHMYNIQIQNQSPHLSTNTYATSLGAVTGLLFSGSVIRELPVKTNDNQMHHTIQKDEMKDCDTWAVVTTIFSLSDAVRLLSNRSTHLCLVIVADEETPAKDVYLEDVNRDNVKFLTVSEQHEFYPLLSETIPLNSVGRKNIGYVYAIHHGAKAIWDFDDDNIGMIDVDDFTSITTYVTACNGFRHNVANPYPYFGVKDNRTWPRGFPLQYINDASTAPKMCKTQETVKLGVVQSLANVEPDVDAIYRLTFDIPFNFTTKKEAHPPFIVPKNVYTPFNAQAALWFPAAFKYMALPISVTGRVSDIWRSYIALHFMHKDGIQLAFAAPYVTQIRNKHENMKDFNAELDLYQKSLQLVNFLSSSETSQIESLMQMYAQLYQRNYFQEDDLKLMNAWIRTLKHILRPKRQGVK